MPKQKFAEILEKKSGTIKLLLDNINDEPG